MTPLRPVRPPRAYARRSPLAGGQPLRVLVGVQDQGLNGVETYAEQVALAAAAVGHDTTLITTTDEVAERVRARTAGSGIEVLSAALPAPSRAELLAERLLPQLHTRRVGLGMAAVLDRHAHRFDLLHLNRPALASYAKGRVDRLYVAGWFYPHEALPRLRETWQHTQGRLARRLVLAAKAMAYYVGDVQGYRACNGVVACTNTLADQLRAQGHDAVTCPPPALTTADLRDEEPRRTASELNLLICSGDLSHPRKNLVDAVRTAELLVRPGRTVVLRVIGAHAELLSDQASKLSAELRIEFLGVRSPMEVREEMRRADAFLLPSLYEEWGYVAVESILSGTPVAAYPVYPFADMFRGGLGSIAAVRSPEGLAEAVERAITGPRGRELAEAGELRFGAAEVGRRLTSIWAQQSEELPLDLLAPSFVDEDSGEVLLAV